MRHFIAFLLSVSFVLTACQNKNDKESKEDLTSVYDTGEHEAKAIEYPRKEHNSAFVSNLEKAHHYKDFYKHKALKYDIKLKFRGEERLSAEVITTNDFKKIRIEKQDGTVLLSENDQVFISPAEKDYKMARFDIYTWNYFILAPFKLSDPGTQIKEMEEVELDDKKLQAAKLTFDSGTGDTPEDWYILYKDPENNQLKGMAYIVTYGTEKEEANKEPHMIYYKEYENVDGVPIATKWEFYMWDEEKGMGEKLGEANISNIKFIETDQETFKLPEDKKKVVMPSAP